MTPRKNKLERELEQMKEQIVMLQQRAKFLKSEGVNVDQVNAALAQLSTDVDSLIASKGQAGITPAEAQTIVDGLTALSTKIKAALTPA